MHAFAKDVFLNLSNAANRVAPYTQVAVIKYALVLKKKKLRSIFGPRTYAREFDL